MCMTLRYRQLAHMFGMSIEFSQPGKPDDGIWGDGICCYLGGCGTRPTSEQVFDFCVELMYDTAYT